MPLLPQIDFVLSSVIVVGLGKRMGPGYSVTIDSIVIHTTGSILFATAAQPGTQCDVSTGVSTPVHMVRFPGHPPIVDWRIAATRRDC
jgi:hypothetical protein